MFTDDQLREKALEAVAAVDPDSRAGVKLPAIRALRMATGLSVHDSKLLVEWAMANPPGRPSPPNALPVLDEACTACDGDGTVPNPAFAALERAYDEGERACLAAGSGLSAWRASAEYRDLDEASKHITELIDCRDCKGAGSIPTEAGRTVLAFVDRHCR